MVELPLIRRTVFPVTPRKLLSVVIPVFNEEEVLPLLIPALEKPLSRISWDYEIILVNDGSRDRSLIILRELAANDARIKVVSFSRNFGHQPVVTAGLDFSRGDAVIIIDADLQDPPDLIPRMIELHEEGYDIVSPQRGSRKDRWFKR